MATGRTVSRWIRGMIDDSTGTPRDIPIDTLSPVGFSYDTTELTAYEDQVKGFLANHPDASIDFGGPLDNSAAQAAAASGAAPALSGSHTVLKPISLPTFTTPLGFVVGFGVRGVYANGDPAFGIAAPTATNGYVLTKYQIEGDKYAASVKPFPSSTPTWVDTILT
jgi:hypothetical protein